MTGVLLRPLAIQFNPYSSDTPFSSRLMTTHRVGNKKINVFSFYFSAAVFNRKLASSTQKRHHLSPILRPKRH